MPTAHDPTAPIGITPTRAQAVYKSVLIKRMVLSCLDKTMHLAAGHSRLNTSSILKRPDHVRPFENCHFQPDDIFKGAFRPAFVGQNQLPKANS